MNRCFVVERQNACIALVTWWSWHVNSSEIPLSDVINSTLVALGIKSLFSSVFVYWGELYLKYGKTYLKQNLKGPEHFSAKARFPFNQGTLHIKINQGYSRIW